MFGDDHVVYSKPVTITEEKMQEALIKQQKQRALREALDRQMAEMAERKQGRFGRRRSSKIGSPAAPTLTPTLGARENGTASSPVKTASPTRAGAAPLSPRSPTPRQKSPTGYKAENIRNMVPVENGAVQRYTLNFEDGQANFVAEPVALKKPSDPLSQRAKEKATEGQPEQQQQRVGGAKLGANKGRKPMAKAGQRNANGRFIPSPRGGGEQWRKAEGEYQTNSLPIQLVEKSPGMPERIGLGASPRVGSGKNGRKYDTQSLPVDAMYQLSEARKNGMPLKGRGGPRPASSNAPGDNDIPQMEAADDEYDHNCLPRNYNLVEDMRQRMGKRSPTKSGDAERQSPSGGRRAPRTTNSRQGGGRGVHGARRDNGTPAAEQSDEEPAGMQEVRSPVRGGRQNVASREKGRRGQSPAGQQQQRGPKELVSQLNKKIESNVEQMRKMREKERGWEDQVKQLKAELRNARQKEKDLTKLVDAKGGGPLRAETAPDGPAGVRTKSPQLRGPQKMQKPTSAIPQSRVGKPDFSRARVFSPEDFHPVAAPSDQLEPTYVPDALSSHLGNGTSASDKSLEAQPDDTGFGLPEYDDTESVIPIGLEHLLQFTEAQIITRQQAERLWTFFLEQPHRLEAQGQEEGEAEAEVEEDEDEVEVEVEVVAEEQPRTRAPPTDKTAHRNRLPSMVTQEISLSGIPQQLPPPPREYASAAAVSADTASPTSNASESQVKAPSPRKKNSATTEIELDDDDDDEEDSDEKEDEEEDASEEETEEEDGDNGAEEEDEEEDDAVDGEDEEGDEDEGEEKGAGSSPAQLARKEITPVLTAALRNKITRRHTDDLTNTNSKEASPPVSPRPKRVSASGSHQGLSPV